MLNRFFELVFCGGPRTCSGALCARWAQTIQGDDGDLWKDLTLRNNIPEPQKPPVPKVVLFYTLPQFDDVSTLYEGSLQQIRYEEFDPNGEEFPDDLELRVESFPERDEDESSILEVERQFFSEFCSTPLTKPRSQRSTVDGDGSSYSTHRQQFHSWKTGSTYTTMETNHTFTPYLTSTQAMI
jgi:hypothetical protein